MIIVFAVSIGLRIFGDDAPPSDAPRDENPRRPNPERFAPKKEGGRVWEQETRDWPTTAPTHLRNEVQASAGLPREGIIKEDSKPGATSGTAFSVSAKGYWLTARHVAEGCAKTGIQTRERGVLKVERTILHPRADVAMLITRRGPEPLRVAETIRPRDAYNIGFPAGQPGAVHTRFMGEMTLRHTGRRIGGGYRERVNAWSERSRVPSRSGSLGGLSGGVVLDGAGRVIGVVQAESRRRGRVMTAQPKTLREMFELAKFTPSSGGGMANLTDDSYPTVARDLILSRRVAKVFCRTD